MKKASLMVMLAALCLGLAQAKTLSRMQAGTGTLVSSLGTARAMWSEPPDLNGLIGTSEIISQFGFETELAADIIPTESVIACVTRRGGFFDNTVPCEPQLGGPDLAGGRPEGAR